jgi:hypothetical protein
VAIGTATPGGGLILDVSGNGRFIGDLDIFNVTGGGVNSKFQYFGSGALSRAAAIYSLTSSATAGNLILATAQTGTGTITERVRVDASGFLLVGATSSLGNGAARIQIGSASAITAGLLLKSTTASLQFYASSGTTANQIWNSGVDMAFGTGPDELSSFAEAMRIKSAGTVGIGTSAPVGRLMVAAADTSNTIGSATASINITNTDAAAFGRTVNLNFTVDDGTLATRRLATISAVYTGFSGGSTAGALAFATQFDGSLSERMRIVEAGNVGIGNTAPTSALDVTGQITTRGAVGAFVVVSRDGSGADWSLYNPSGDDVRLFGNSADRLAVTNAGNLGLGTNTPDVSNYRTFVMDSAGASLFMQRVSGTEEFSIYTDSGITALNTPTNPMTFATSNTERMRIDSSGNVGVGGTTPFSKITAYVTSSGTFQSAIGATNSVDSDLQIRIKTNITDFYNSAGSLTFSTVGDLERMRIDSSGNVLIGTTSDAGVATNTAKLIGGVFATVRSSLSVASGVATTIVTLPSGEGNYIVSASLQGSTDPANYNEVAVVSISASASSIAILVNASIVSLTMSGLNLQVTQNQGATQTIQFSVLRIL